MKKYGWWIALGAIVALLVIRFIVRNVDRMDEWLLSLPSLGWLGFPIVALFIAWIAGRKRDLKK